MDQPTRGRTFVFGAITSYDVKATEVGHNLYRLDEEPLFDVGADDLDDLAALPRYGDTVFATPLPDDALLLQAVHARADLKRIDFWVPKHLVTSGIAQQLLNVVHASGGYAELHMGTLMMISLPSDSPLDPAAELDELVLASERALQAANPASSS